MSSGKIFRLRGQFTTALRFTRRAAWTVYLPSSNERSIHAVFS